MASLKSGTQSLSISTCSKQFAVHLLLTCSDLTPSALRIVHFLSTFTGLNLLAIFKVVDFGGNGIPSLQSAVSSCLHAFSQLLVSYMTIDFVCNIVASLISSTYLTCCSLYNLMKGWFLLRLH